MLALNYIKLLQGANPSRHRFFSARGSQSNKRFNGEIACHQGRQVGSNPSSEVLLPPGPPGQ